MDHLLRHGLGKGVELRLILDEWFHGCGRASSSGLASSDIFGVYDVCGEDSIFVASYDVVLRLGGVSTAALVSRSATIINASIAVGRYMPDNSCVGFGSC